MRALHSSFRSTFQAFGLALGLALIASAQAPAPAAALAPSRPKPPEVAARQYILVDLSSQQVLAESGADQQAETASLTKLMTAYLVFNALRDKKLTLEQTLPVSERAWNERGQAGPSSKPARAGGAAGTGKGGKAGKAGKPAKPGKGGKVPSAAPSGASLMFIDTTMKPSVDELLRGLIVQSGNDAAVALAEGVAGSVEAFVAAMNQQAEAWGLKNTHYRNVTGLTEAGQHSSARDVAFVAGRIIAEHPTLFPLYSLKSYTYNGIKQDNRNRLLGRDPSVDGMKTGRTDAAGWCLVATAQRDSAGNKRRLLSVVLGAASDEARAAESHKLLEWGYSAWETVRLVEPRQALATVPLWKGTLREARLGVAEALVVTVPRGESARLQPVLTRTDPLLAPLAVGQAVGTVKVNFAGGTTVASVPLVALDAVPQAGWFGRTWDSVRLWWH